MWHLIHIEATNFISFKKFELDIPQGQCSLLYGINMDNDNQKNNGTGKSSLTEAIGFILTGEPLREVDKTEEIINDNADKSILYAEFENDYDNSLFTIQRVIYRDKTAQVISCHKYNADDVEIETEKTVQPSVYDYNRYILEEIGITKEDIYSNFILSGSHYKSFFNASDKTKKAMINRFSGADAVDSSIEAIKADMIPLQQNVQDAKEKKIAVEAKLAVVKEQIDNIALKYDEFENDKAGRISAIEQKIAEKREEMRQCQEQIRKADKRLDKIDEIGDNIENMRNISDGLDGSYLYIASTFKDNNLPEIKDYMEKSSELQSNISKNKELVSSFTKELDGLDSKCQELKEVSDKTKDDFDVQKMKLHKMVAANDEAYPIIESEIQELENKIKQTESDIVKLKGERDIIQKNIADVDAILHGTITCPKCKHQFIFNSDMSIDQLNEKKDKLSDKESACNTRIETAEDNIKLFNDSRTQALKRKSDIDEAEIKANDLLREFEKKHGVAVKAYNNILTQIDNLQGKIKRCNVAIESDKSVVETLLTKMFDEALDIIDDAISKGERYIDGMKDKVTIISSAIEEYNRSIQEIKSGTMADFEQSLTKQREQFAAELDNAVEEYDRAECEYNKLAVQENHFVDFRSHLANQKISAISAITNQTLEFIGSDIRVELLGFKRLKSGKIRDKITVNLLRNGIPCGSYNRYSAGEKSRVNLASIIGLQKLTNATSPKGKGLDLIIIDEILDSADVTGIESCCEALNKTKITSLFVTQQVANYHSGKTIQVVKENGYSRIEK